LLPVTLAILNLWPRLHFFLPELPQSELNFSFFRIAGLVKLDDVGFQMSPVQNNLFLQGKGMHFVQVCSEH
jgi:hypothetical protein